MDSRVKERMEKVRAAASTVGSMAGNTARQAGKYAGEWMDMTKLNFRMFDLNNEINVLLKEIGQIMYNTHIGKEPEEALLEEKLAAIDVKKESIAQLQGELNQLKRCAPCPQCGTACSKEDAFCKKCGAKL